MSKTLDMVHLAVIGAPGHGKSLFLNSIGLTRNAFKTAAGKGSCTQEVSQQVFTMQNGDVSMGITLIDTMGFPDPNPENAIPYYDQVVQVCNRPLNAIVWLLRFERKIMPLVEMYKVLLQEFAAAKCPVIIVVNGFSNYEDEEEREELKGQELQDAEEFGKEIAKMCGINVLKVLAGAEKKDLRGKIRGELGMTLMGTVPRSSSIRSYDQLDRESKACVSDQDAAKKQLDQESLAREQLVKNLQNKRADLERMSKKKGETKMVWYRDWYTLWIGGHWETELVHDQAAVQKEIDACQVELARVEGRADASKQSKEKKELLFNERVRATRAAQENLQRLKAALLGRAPTPARAGA